MSRRAGLLLHPTSLPGPFGVGDIGPAAERFLDFLAAAGQKLWQFLPLGPPAWAGSPYGALSAFAGNPLLLSPERLFEDGLLVRKDFSPLPRFPAGQVAFGKVEPYKEKLLRRAWERFRAGQGEVKAVEVEAYRQSEATWLEDWAIFAALKAAHGGKPHWEWKKPLAQKRPAAIRQIAAQLRQEIDYQVFLQFLFARQWRRLRHEAGRRGVALMGDLPIYIARDSADLWSQPHLFDLDQNLEPRHVAGVPPDYFSKDGQLWGNPLYDWRRMAREGFRWWKQRLRANLAQADLVRLDHFRGFAGFWQVRSGERTARNGSWQPGPGAALFSALAKDLGRLPLVAEDLGEITLDVDQLRDAFGLPGMKVLQFGFGHEPNGHTPHNVGKNMVVYTGTHDNDTAAGWMRKLPKEDRERFRSYTGAGAKEPAWTLIRTAYTTAAEIALVPVQDVLGLGNSARMNTPGKSRGNWAWRLAPGVLRKEHADRLRRLAEVSERVPK